MPKVYYIKDWDLYESSESRKVKKLTFYSKQNKLDGEGIGFTLQQDDNVALLGTWTLIETLASKSERAWRGWLVRNGTALTAPRMAALTRVDVKHFIRALEHFTSAEVGWLLVVDVPTGDSPDTLPLFPPKSPVVGMTPGDSPDTLPQVGKEGRKEGIGKEGKEKVGDDLPASPLPSSEDIDAFCAASGVPLDYARHKITTANERKDFAKPGWQNGWRDKLKRFWKDDEAMWGKSKKNAPARNASGQPDGWQDGDHERWWTDTLAEVQAELTGAVLGQNEKNAARLREIIEARGKK